MSTAVLDRLRTERDEARDLAISMAEGESFDPTSPDFQELQSRAEALDSRINVLVAAMEARESARKMDARVIGSVESRAPQAQSQTRQSIGETFVRSAQFTGYGFRGTMPGVELPMLETRAPLGVEDLVGADASAFGRLLRWKDTPQAVLTPLQDIATIIPVTTNSIEVAVLDYKTPPGQAAKVAEKTPKPETEFVTTVVPQTLDLIATWTQFTRQLAEDAGSVRALIERKLVRSVLLKLEAEAQAAAVGGTYGGVAQPQDDGALLGGIRVAMAELQSKGYSPNAVLLNPVDWAAFDISAQKQQTVGQTGIMQPSYWGLTVVPVAGVTAKTALVADASQAFEVYRRTGVQTFITDSHGETFISNVFTLLAEARQKTVVTDPGAVRKVTVTAAP